MKKNIILVVALLTSTLLFGQHRSKNPKEMAAHQTEKMKSVLSLNDTQYASIMKINETYADSFMRLRHDSTATREKKFDEMKALRQQKQKEVNAVLTTDQQVKWKSFTEENRHRNEKHGHVKQGKHKNYRAHLKDSLSLTDDQAGKIEAENKNLMDKKTALRNDSTLSKEEKMKKMKSLHADHEQAVKNILTPEQFEKWKALKHDMHHRKRD